MSIVTLSSVKDSLQIKFEGSDDTTKLTKIFFVQITQCLKITKKSDLDFFSFREIDQKKSSMTIFGAKID